MARRPSSKSAKRPRSGKGSRQLVVTLDASDRGIEKIEELGSTGKRRIFSDAEFAALAGNDGLEDLCEALETAYLAGVEDGFEETQSDDAFADESADGKGAREFIGEDVLRSGIRRIILRRALRRKLERADGSAPHNGAQHVR
jgi:hypothetical protein